MAKLFMMTNPSKLFVLLFLMMISSSVLQAQSTISHVFGDSPLPSPDGVINTSDGTQQGRLFRGGVPTTCADNYPAGLYGASTTYAFEAYAFMAATTGCLEIDVTQTSTNLYIAVYEGAYDPGNVTANRVAEQGSSSVGVFGGEVVGGQDYTLVVMGVNPGVSGIAYSVTLDNVMEASPVPIAAWWVLLPAISMLVFLVYRKRFVNA
jgi:hypothetical protein